VILWCSIAINIGSVVRLYVISRRLLARRLELERLVEQEIASLRAYNQHYLEEFTRDPMNPKWRADAEPRVH
jgi:hypothetical protein